MRTRLNIDDSTLSRAAQLTGVRDTNALVRMGLGEFIARKGAGRLAALGGTEKKLTPICRRRSK